MRYTHLEKRRYGGYLLYDEDGNECKPTRVSSLAKVLGDTENLTKWKQRMTAHGLGLRPDLYALACSTDKDDKRTLDDLCRDAMGSVPSAANYGTAIHKATEDVDAGKAYNLPEDLRGDVRAYVAVRDKWGLKPAPEYIEATLVNNRFSVAGTTDRFYIASAKTVELIDAAVAEINERRARQGMPLMESTVQAGHLVVGDVKTGRVDYGADSMPIQLYVYASAEQMAHDTGDGRNFDLRPAPPVNQSVGLIIHVPAGKGQAVVYLADLGHGERGAKAAREVLDWRDLTFFKTQTTLARGGPLDRARATDPGQRDLAEMIVECGSKAELEALFKAERNRFTPRMKALAIQHAEDAGLQ